MAVAFATTSDSAGLRPVNIVLYVAFIFMNAYSLSAINFFAVLGLLASESLRIISTEIREVLDIGSYGKLRKRWREYVIVHEFIEYLIHSFQLILLVDFSCIFVGCITNFVNSSFHADSMEPHLFYTALGYVVMNLNRLFIIIYVADRIQYQVLDSVTFELIGLVC